MARNQRPLDGILFLFQLAAIAVLWGRAWQHWFWDVPFRSFFWDEALLRGFVEKQLDWDWSDYATSVVMDDFFWKLSIGLGIFYFVVGLLVMFIRRIPRWLHFPIPIASFFLFLLALLYFKSKFYSIAQLFEYGLQIGAPIFVMVYARIGTISDRFRRQVQLAISLTFVAHGLYAIGFYPRPGHFTAMVIEILGLSNELANQFLIVAGILDFVAAVIIWLPGLFRVTGLAYCFTWGMATAVARIWANFYPAIWQESLFQYFHEFLYRMPHFLIPLALLVWWSQEPLRIEEDLVARKQRLMARKTREKEVK